VNTHSVREHSFRNTPLTPNKCSALRTLVTLVWSAFFDMTGHPGAGNTSDSSGCLWLLQQLPWLAVTFAPFCHCGGAQLLLHIFGFPFIRQSHPPLPSML